MAATREVVVGVFRERGQALAAIEELREAGFDADSVGLIGRDEGEGAERSDEGGAGSGVVTGVYTGGLLGGVAGWLVGIGALAIPGVGPLIAAGALATALGGVALGAGIGAVAGSLVDVGVPEEEAAWYAEEVRGGGTLVTVRATSRSAEALAIMQRHDAYDATTRPPDASDVGGEEVAMEAPEAGPPEPTPEPLAMAVTATDAPIMFSATSVDVDEPLDYDALQPSLTVLDRDGAPIGTLVHLVGDELKVQPAPPVHPLYIPLTEVERVTPNGIATRVARHDIESGLYFHDEAEGLEENP